MGSYGNQNIMSTVIRQVLYSCLFAVVAHIMWARVGCSLKLGLYTLIGKHMALMHKYKLPPFKFMALLRIHLDPRGGN